MVYWVIWPSMSSFTEATTQNEQVLGVPANVVRIGNLNSSIDGALIDSLGWSLDETVDVAEALMRVEHWQRLSLPMEEIVPRKAHGHSILNVRFGPTSC
jgi:hypothetical protein